MDTSALATIHSVPAARPLVHAGADATPAAPAPGFLGVPTPYWLVGAGVGLMVLPGMFLPPETKNQYGIPLGVLGLGVAGTGVYLTTKK